MFEVGFIGVGVMSSAIINRMLIGLLDYSNLILYDLDQERLNEYKSAGAHVAENAEEVLNKAKIVFIGVKPQQMRDALPKNKKFNCLVLVSMQAGISIETLYKQVEKYNKDINILRIMPNLPVLVGDGVVAYCANSTSNYLNNALKYLSNCGLLLPIEERLFDTITSISGSGPAYVAYFIDAMLKSAIKNGLSKEQAQSIVFSTFIGSVNYLKHTNISVETFIDKVCSKGGTTIEAINYFDLKGLDNLIITGLDKAKKRSEELSNIANDD